MTAILSEETTDMVTAEIAVETYLMECADRIMMPPDVLDEYDQREHLLAEIACKQVMSRLFNNKDVKISPR